MSKINQSLREEFQRFIEFGGILDRQTRKYLVRYLASWLEPQAEPEQELRDDYYRYFVNAIGEIFGYEGLKKLLSQHEAIGNQIISDTLFWLRKTYKKVAEKSPFEKERQELEAWSVYHLRHFVPKWQYMLNRLTGYYHEDELNLKFYKQRMEQIIAGREYEELVQDEAAVAELELVLTDLLGQWDALYQSKVLKFQLSKLDEEKEAFQSLMEAKAREYERITKLLSPFASYVGRYWDMSSDLWKDTTFDVIKEYDDLLQNEASLQQLVDLLGQLREAEQELEEETFERTIIRKEWVKDPLQRSEVTGIRESDDLSNLLSSEVSLLGHPDTEALFLKKYVDKALLTLQYEDRRLVNSTHTFTEVNQKVRRKEKGPFIVCVDTSMSMEGRPEHLAKVLCFGILKMAAKENRRAYLINFSNQIKTMDLLNLSDSLDEVAKFLRMSFMGGTDISLPIYEALRQLKSNDYKDADVLIISDFILYRLDEQIIREIEYHQQNKGTQFHALTLSEYPNEKLIDALDNNWIYDPGQKGVVRSIYRDLQGLNERQI